MSQDATNKWLGKMRQQFLEGTFCDVTIRVTVATSSADNSETSPQPHTEDIPCHSVVLSTRSDYFDRALRGGFKEKETKVVCITREDDEDLMHFKLLLELSYSSSYTHDDEGVELDRDTRLRLALVANEFEFEECMNQCIDSLRNGLKLEEQIMCLEVELSALQGRECLKGWKNTVSAAVIAGGLGPVRDFFEERPSLKEVAHGKGFYEVVPLKAAIKALSVEAMEALLGSDKLGVQVEDEAYYLLGAWIHQSIHIKAEDRMPIFTSLVSKIRFHHISPDYLACVVTHCPLARESGLVFSFLQSALVHREASNKAIAVQKIDIGARDRGTGNAELGFNIIISLDDVVGLQKGKYIRRYMAVVAGFPVAFFVERRAVGDTCGLYVEPLMTEVQGEMFASCLECRVGFGFSFRTNTMLTMLSYQYLFDGKQLAGSHDFLSKPWEEVVKENSLYFPGGKMSVTVTLKKLTKNDL